MLNKIGIFKLSLVIWSFGSVAAAQSLESIAVSSVNAISGQSVTVTVSTSSKCRTGGCVIAIASSNNAAAPVSASITIPYDRKSASKSFIAGTVTEKTFVTLSALYSGVTKTTGSTFTVSPAVTSTPPPTGTIVATYTNSGDSSYPDREWNLAIEYLSSLPSNVALSGIRAKYEACMTANAGNGQLTAVGGVIKKSVVSTGFGRANYTVEQNFTCAAGYTGWLEAVTISGSSWVNNDSTSSLSVCLVKAAPVGGVVAQIVSSKGYFSVPTSLTIPEGQLCASFTALESAGISGNVDRIYIKLNGFQLTTALGIN